MQLRDLEDLRKIFKRISGKIAGIGITAFSRISLAFFMENFKIFCLKNTLDLPILRKIAHITCLGELEEGLNYLEATSTDILSSETVQRELLDSDIKHLYVYQSYHNMEMLLKDRCISTIANEANLREKVSSKEFFVKFLEDLAIRQLRYEIITSKELLDTKAGTLFNMFKGPFVVQSLQIKKGGGRGVFIVETEGDLSHVREIISQGMLHNVRLKDFLLRPYVKGTSMSMLGCVTRVGVLAGPLQYQLIDLHGPTSIGERGIFCGHSWSDDMESSLLEEASRLIKKVGNGLKDIGYRGIYGIDLIWDGKELFPLELNPRLTGALPALTLLQLEKNVVPLELIHVLAFVEPSIRYDLSSLEDSLMAGVKGAQILIFYHKHHQTLSPKLRAGRYVWNGQRAIFLGPSSGLIPKGEREFIVVEVPRVLNERVLEGGGDFLRMARILFKNPVLDDNGDLLDWVRDLLKWEKGENLGGDKRTLSSDNHNTSCLQQGSG